MNPSFIEARLAQYGQPGALVWPLRIDYLKEDMTMESEHTEHQTLGAAHSHIKMWMGSLDYRVLLSAHIMMRWLPPEGLAIKGSL